MTDTPVNWPSLIYPGLSWPALAPGQAMLRHMMHELPACLLFAWVRIDTRLQITSTPAAAWALTTLYSVMHCNRQTSAWRDGGGKGTPPTRLPPVFKHLLNLSYSSLLYRFSSLRLIPVCILLLLSLFMDMPACASTLHRVCYDSTGCTNLDNRGQNIPVSVHSRLVCPSTKQLKVEIAPLCFICLLLDVGWLFQDTSVTYFHISVFDYLLASMTEEKLERCRLQIGLNRWRWVSCLCHKVNGSPVEKRFGPTFSLCVWQHPRHVFTSNIMSATGLSKGELMGHYCVGPWAFLDSSRTIGWQSVL